MPPPASAFRPGLQKPGYLIKLISNKLSEMFDFRHGVWTAWLVPAIYAGCFAAFAADMTSVNTLAFGVFYAPLVVTAVFHRDPRAVWVLSGIASIMVVLGAIFPSIDPDVGDLTGNRVLSLCAVFATAAFVRHARMTQDRLTKQTLRAEAAERIRTEVLTNLSQEIRAPLYSMLGVLELVAAGSQPGQRTALHMVRGSGRRLVATLDNLVDLTQFDATVLPLEPIDFAMLLHQTMEAARSDAAARQIGLTITLVAGTGTLVRANPWGLRRILENLIADAILYTAPGGRIEVSVLSEPNHVSAVIADAGTRPPGALPLAEERGFERLTPSVMGLALSQRLAQAMGARLTFGSVPGEGTTARLRLPMAERRPLPH